MPSTATGQVYNNANDALNTLSNLWQTMLQIIQAVSAASASSLTAEPDLAKLQKTRKEYETLMNSLKAKVEWLQANQLKQNELELETENYKSDLKEQEELQLVSRSIVDLIKCLALTHITFNYLGICAC
jgi:hypothetical protein